MSYRRNVPSGTHEEKQAHTSWVCTHGETLRHLGFPQSTFETRERWHDILENGHLHWHPSLAPFDALELPSGTQRLLLDFLRAHVEHPERWPLTHWLSYRVEGS